MPELGELLFHEMQTPVVRQIGEHHGLFKRNHTSRFILNFSFFDVLAFGGSAVVWRAVRDVP
jgi:hypothetical protein